MSNLVNLNLYEVRQIRIESLSFSNSLQGGHSGELHLVCLLSGSFYADVRDTEPQVLHAGAVVIVPPNESYRFVAQSEHVCGLRIVLPFSINEVFANRGYLPVANEMRRFFSFSKLIHIVLEDSVSHARIMTFFSLLENYAGDNGSAIYSKLNIIELLLLELGQFAHDPAQGLQQARRTRGHSQLIKDVISYINEHYMDDIRLDSIAKKFWVNPSYLSRHFSEKVGNNINGFIKEHRIYMAKKLLLTTDMMAAEIAVDCGFNSATYFNAVFKKEVGVSPQKFRKQNAPSAYERGINHG